MKHKKLNLFMSIMRDVAMTLALMFMAFLFITGFTGLFGG